MFGKWILCKGTEYFSKGTDGVSIPEQPVAVSYDVEELHLHCCNQRVGVKRDPRRLAPTSTSGRMLVQPLPKDLLAVVARLPTPVLPALSTNKFFPLCNVNLPCFSSSPFLLALCALAINYRLLPFLLAAAFYVQEESHHFWTR